ncbi:hypothetical protein GCM10025760_15490 [Microbacterium yannicii]|uniref:Thioester domain-containing protein n=1 Tax=Microbacterium yannicii TaxID=671622 RepID=A0ABP9M6P7_9MICO|nr:hypothetical protein [Microbacterium yannicii]MCO5954983.1 hypothetical protein [Microbacterium yannicii]
MSKNHRKPLELSSEPASPILRLLFARLPASAYLLLLPLLIVLLIIDVMAPPHAGAAERGVGFGTWAPISAYGWHGSMLIGGVHTYCITPGAPAPTGPSTDHGISGSAAGLSPQQLAGINLLISTYGQTEDPVQAAAVAWAVKAIANRDETLHAFGYPGDSLAGAIHWTLSALAPQHDRAVQERAVAYYDEATRAASNTSSPTGRLVFSTDAADHRSGTVRVEATGAAAGTVTLVNAVFAGSGSPTLDNASAGTEYAIRAVPPAEGRAYTVSGTGRFRTGLPAAVRHYTTPGGQQTAGPAAPLEFEIVGADAAPRVPPFSPRISTRVPVRVTAGGPYIDEVTFSAEDGSWPRAEDGSYLPVTAVAVVYRTDAEPVPGAEVPTEASVVGSLRVTTDALAGPTMAYTVASPWEMTAPGFYTAVWSVTAADQVGPVAAHTGPDFAWTERFGEPSQVAVVAPPPATPTPLPAPSTESPAPPVEDAPAATPERALAATGMNAGDVRAPAALAIGLLSIGIAIVASRRPRFGARPTIR